MPRLSLLLVLLTVLLVVLAQVLIKAGVNALVRDGHSVEKPLLLLAGAFSSAPILLGLLCGAVGAATWIMALSQAELSRAYPFTGLTIVSVLTVAQFALGEQVPVTRWIGAIVVGIGIWLAAM